jgi:HK97 family phage prohead protease
MEKSAGIALEFKDLDTNKRTAVIKHAVYTSIDRVKDISTKGMFTKSWNENKPDFLFNHIEGKTVGSTIKTFDDESGAFTEVKFGNWTLGNDVLEMASEGVLKGASFGYITDKKDFVQIKGQKVRKLLEVKHIETSLLTVLPAHPEAGIVLLNKSLADTEIKQLTDSEKSLLQSLLSNDISNMQSLINVASSLDIKSDLYTWIMYQISRRADWADSTMSRLYYDAQSIKSINTHIQTVEAFCRKSKASDETIISLQNSVDEYKQIISDYDTAITQLIPEPVASDDEIKSIQNFINSLNIETWKKHSLSN